MAEELLNISETEIQLSNRLYCPLIKRYFPSAKNWRTKIQCPLADKCQHPTC